MGNNKTFYDLQLQKLVERLDNKTINNLSTSKRILIDGENMFYLEFIEKIFNNEFKGDNKINKSKIMYVGYISDYLINSFRNLNVDLEGFIMAFDSDCISHAINHHINKNEVKRGQINLSIDDFKSLPKILGNIVSVEEMRTNKQTQKVYCIICKFNSYDFFIFEAISCKRNTLLFNTMWKK